jgi:hypothetical protein
MRLTSSTLRSASLPCRLNSILRTLLPLCVFFPLLSLLSVRPSDGFMKHQTTAITLTLLVRSIGAVSTFFPFFGQFVLRETSVLTLHHMTDFLRHPFRSLWTQVAARGKSSLVLFGPAGHQFRPNLPAVPCRAVHVWHSDGRRVGFSLIHRARKSPS